MTLTLCTLIVALLITNTLGGLEIHRLRRKINQLPSEDICLAALEAHAVSSPRAQHLLLAAGEIKEIPPDWKHSPSADCPPQEHWKIFLRDMTLETDDTGRLQCLGAWLDSNNSFTAHERAEVSALFETAEARHASRRLFVEKQNSKKKTDDAAAATNPTT